MKTQKPLSPRQETERIIRRRTFLSFSVFTLAGASGLGLWSWLRSLPKNAYNLAVPARKVLSFNEKVNSLFFSNTHLAPTYPLSRAAPEPRINGKLGMDTTIDSGKWMLQVNHPLTKKTIFISNNELRTLPKTEIVFDLKCIEGWNEIVHYGGVKFSDFLYHYQIGTNTDRLFSAEHPQEWFRYIGLETPDRAYYVGIDMKSMLHPQTILSYEMNGKELTPEHGAPLRLIIPTKYGIKNLKRIGRMFFSDTPPRDYWHEQGYDYDAAL
jgi:DMSO/TMAO reductase YedYZ molybdopterin-dependent catalytic subunit